MKNCLLIVTESRSANGICAAAAAEELKKRGYGVFAATNRETGGVSFSDGIPVVTYRPRLYYRLAARAERTAGAAKKLLSLLSALSNKAALLFGIPTWPLVSRGYCRRIFRAAYRLCTDENIDTIIPVYTQIDTVIAAVKIKKKLPGVRVIPYFLDSLSGGYGPRCFSHEWTVKRGLEWEDRLLPHADRIVMMKSAEEHYRRYSAGRDYYGKIVFLDLPLFRPEKPESGKSGILPDGVINLLYIGSIPLGIRNPEYFLSVFRQVAGENIRLHIVGTCTDEEFLEKAARADRRIVLHRPVSHDTALEMIREADLLVNFGNSNPAMTPCKIFEYMSSGKPVISTAPIENEPGLVYLEKYPVKLVIREYAGNRDADAAALAGFIASARPVGGEELAGLEEVFWLNTPAAFADAVSEGEETGA